MSLYSEEFLFKNNKFRSSERNSTSEKLTNGLEMLWPIAR